MEDKINDFESESILTMFASEDVLENEWENEYDKRWNLII